VLAVESRRSYPLHVRIRVSSGVMRITPSMDIMRLAPAVDFGKQLWLQDEKTNAFLRHRLSIGSLSALLVSEDCARAHDR